MSSAFSFKEKNVKEFFQKLLDFIKAEPAAFGGAVTALIQAIIGALVAFNIPLTDAQQQAVLGLTGAVVSLTVLVAVVIRQNVTPTARPRNNNGENLVPEEKPGE